MSRFMPSDFVRWKDDPRVFKVSSVDMGGSGGHVYRISPPGATLVSQEIEVPAAELQQADWIRASGEASCEACGKLYRQHPHETDPAWLGYDGQPVLRVLCDGLRVKL